MEAVWTEQQLAVVFFFSGSPFPYELDPVPITSIDIPVEDEEDLPGGTAQSGGKLFAAIPSDPSFIAVFSDQPPYNRLPDMPIDGLKSPRDLVVCDQMQCIYVADDSVSCVFRKPLNDGTADVFFSGSTPVSLSVDYGKLVISLDTGELLILAADRRQLHCVELPNDWYPRHAVQTAHDTLIVSCEEIELFKDSHICELDFQGTVLRDYNCGFVDPMRVALDAAGRVFVVDIEDSRRVLILSPELKLMGELVSGRRQDDLYYVRDICYHDATGQLMLNSDTKLYLFNIKP